MLDLGHAHPVDDLLHHLDRAGRARHDAGPEAGQVVGLDAGDRQLGDEHRGDAVKARAALVLYRLERLHRVEGRGRDDHGRAVAGCGQVAHHHAEAVVEGDGNADPVLFGVMAQLADEEAVVEDVVVAKRGALREARCARGVLDVDGVVGGELNAFKGGVTDGNIGVFPRFEQFAPGVGVEEDDLLQVRAARPHFGDHGGVVGGLQPLGGDQQLATRLVEHELKLAGAVGGVDVDQDRADLGGGVLGDDPLGPVGRPDADPVALGDAQAEQGVGEGIDLVLQLRVGEAQPGGDVDQGEAVGEPGGRAVEVRADRVAEQRRVARRGRVAELRAHGCPPFPSGEAGRHQHCRPWPGSTRPRVPPRYARAPVVTRRGRGGRRRRRCPR